MPPTAATLRVGRYFLSLLIIFIVLFGLVFLPGQRHTPKLGLDLEGGKQVVLQAKKPGGGIPTSSSMRVARTILTDRVNGRGVSAAEVQQEGQDRIVISVPGNNKSDLSNIEKSAQLNFRPVMFAPVASQVTAPAPTAGSAPPSSTSTSSGNTSPSGSAPPVTKTGSSGSPGGLVQPLLAPLTPPASTPVVAPVTPAIPPSKAAVTTAPTLSTTPKASASPPPAALPEVKDPFSKLGFALPTSDTQFNALPTAQQSQLAAALQRFQCGSKPDDIPTKPLAACDTAGEKFLLGPVIVAGSQIQTASAVAPNAQAGTGWQVSLSLKDSGDKAWSKYTGAHHSASSGGSPSSASTCSATTVPCAEYVGFTLDGDVVSTPHNESTISGVATSISGSFTQKTASELANQLKYGALPLSLSVLTNSEVSATLGAGQLQAGLLAGGIGLLLVVIYSLLYYRALGLVTIASLLVSAGLTYGSLVVLGREMGFTLTLAGIAGFIVAVGITADSFVVLFERLKDEIHSGRSMRVAVPRAWTRARRTILSADTVSFLAAAVLYYFAAGDVRGFAFTLGLSTILDLVVVFLFTHPLVSLLSRSRAFGSARFTGLNSVRTGGPAVVASSRPTQPATSSRRRGRGATALGTAVLEPDLRSDVADDSDLSDGLDDSATGVVAAPPARKRTSTAVGASAAERAAARRGREVRPPKPEPSDTAVDDTAADDTAVDDTAVDDIAADIVDDAKTGVDEPPAAAPLEPIVAEPISVPVEAPAPRRTSTAIGAGAAERAAVRRGRAARSTPSNTAQADTAQSDTTPTDTTQADTVPTDTVQADTTSTPGPAISPAAQRAADRRARIRTRAGVDPATTPREDQS